MDKQEPSAKTALNELKDDAPDEWTLERLAVIERFFISAPSSKE